MIERHLPLVHAIARRFAGRGEPLDDLVQVGNVALITAVDRCERGRELQFAAYAAVCVEGEIKRHLRDRCDPLRVPRHLQQDTALMASLRAPAPIDEEMEAVAAASDEIGISRAVVTSAARSLDRRERLVVGLRYFGDLSQAEIGAAVGLSQVQVSRLLQKALGKMRLDLAGPGIGSERECRQAAGGGVQRSSPAPDAAGAPRRARAGGRAGGRQSQPVDRDAAVAFAHRHIRTAR
jgi:RNA polymerase sigma-B factor